MIRLFSTFPRCLTLIRRNSHSSTIFNRTYSHSVVGCCDFRQFHSCDFRTLDGRISERSSNGRKRYRQYESGGHNRHRSRTNWKGIGTSVYFLPAFSLWSTFKQTVGIEKPKKEDEIQEKIKQAAAYCRHDQYEDALAVLHEALFKAEEDKNDNAINYCLDMMANIYYFVGNYDGAIQTFGTLMQRMIEKKGDASGDSPTTSAAFVELSLKLADVYALKGDDEKAVSGFEFCVATQKVNVEKEIANHKKKSFRHEGPTRHDFGDDPESTDPYALYGLVLETYARYLVRKGRIDESQSYINRALEMALEIFGSSHPHVLTVMNNYAILCISQGRFDVAETYLKQVVTKAPLSDDGGKHITGYYTNYAEVLWHLGRHDEALEYARKAAKLASDAVVSEEARKSAQEYLKTIEADYKKVSKKKGK